MVVFHYSINLRSAVKIRLLATLLFCLHLITAREAVAAEIPEDPQSAARVFYAELRRLGLRSLPTVAEWEPFAPRATPELTEAIERAREEQTEFMEKFPDEKPPWVDGDLFSSLFEGPQRFEIGEAKITSDRAEVPVTCLHTYGGDTAKWTDVLILTKTESVWLVDDLRYGGTWDFAAQGTLRDALMPEGE
jgi:hypothetical protein